LVLFAGALTTLLIVAALAFDVGLMVLERRDQQNAADAAAMAGARYVMDSATGTTDCSTVTGPAPAPDSAGATAWAACNVAMTNDSGNDETVLVHVPPIQGEFRGFPGFVEVDIQSERHIYRLGKAA
jgi:Flp pilus assembly protein TadG